MAREGTSVSEFVSGMGSTFEVVCMGMQLQQPSGRYPEVIDLSSGGTAESDGVLRGDIITRIDDEDISGFSSGYNLVLSDQCIQNLLSSLLDRLCSWSLDGSGWVLS